MSLLTTPFQPFLPDPQAEIERRYQLHAPQPWKPLAGGEECLVWRFRTGSGWLVVRVSPQWRTEAEICWVHQLMCFTAMTVPEVVAPLPAKDGVTLFIHAGYPVALFPFVEGQPLNREKRSMREAAARLLAHLHRAMLVWPALRSRPPISPAAPYSWPREYHDQVLPDADLDAWHTNIYQAASRITGPTHGDYYRRNLLCRRGRIQGIIDWDQSHLAPLIEELAWATWEFAKVPSGTDLDDQRARAFLAAYHAAAGPAPVEEQELIIPLIRWRLREEVRRSTARAARGETGEATDQEYRQKEMEAFARLRGRRL